LLLPGGLLYILLLLRNTALEMAKVLRYPNWIPSLLNSPSALSTHNASEGINEIPLDKKGIWSCKRVLEFATLRLHCLNNSDPSFRPTAGG
jgi:hypothetical protein